MALPVTITGISTVVACVGPFKVADAYYFFGRNGTTATTLSAFKSTAPDTSWSSIATKTGFTTAILTLNGYQVGNVIHLLVCDGTAATSVATKYVSFDTSTDTFLTTTETVAAAASNAGQIGAAAVGCSLVVRTNGEVVAFYNGLQTKTSGTFRARVYYRRRTGVNTWSTETMVDAAGAVDNRWPIVVLGASDRCHFLWFDSSLSVQRHLTSANVLGTAASIGSTVTMSSDVVSMDDGGTIRLVGFAGNTVYRFNSADNPTVSTANITLGDATRGVDDNLIVYALYRSSADSDLYIKSSSDDGATWGTAASAFIGTVTGADPTISKNQRAYQRGSNVVFPYIVNDNGTLKYNEYVVRTSGPAAYTMPAATGAVALAGPANKLAYGRVMPVTAGALAFSLKDAGLAYGRKLVAVAGSLVLSGTVTEFHRSMAAAKGAFLLAGVDATLTKGTGLTFYTMPAATGAVAFTPQPANLRSARLLPVTTGSFNASFKDANLVYAAVVSSIQVSWVEVSGTEALAPVGAYTLTADAGAFVASFKATALRIARKLAAVTGAFTLAGFATGLVYSRKLSMPAALGTFALAGQAAILRFGHRLVATVGTFTLAGQVTGLRFGHALVAVTGAFALAGQVTRLAAARIITVAKGSLAFTYWAASLVKSGSYALLASTGALTFTRVDANLQTTRKLVAVVGTFALSGKVTGLLHNRMLTSATGAISFSGVAANLLYPRKFSASVGAFTLTGFATSFARGKLLTANTGALLFTWKPVILTTGAFSGIMALPGSFVLSGKDAEFNIHTPPPKPVFMKFVRPVSHIMRQW